MKYKIFLKLIFLKLNITFSEMKIWVLKLHNSKLKLPFQIFGYYKIRNYFKMAIYFNSMFQIQNLVATTILHGTPISKEI